MECRTPVEALLLAARARALLTAAMAQRLAALAAARRIADVDEARRWLAGDAPLDTGLAQRLLGLLPRPGQPPFGIYQPLAHLGDDATGSRWLAAGPGSGLVLVEVAVPPPDPPGEASIWLGADDPVRPEPRSGHTTLPVHGPVDRLGRPALDQGTAADGSPFVVLDLAGGALEDPGERWVEGLEPTPVGRDMKDGRPASIPGAHLVPAGGAATARTPRIGTDCSAGDPSAAHGGDWLCLEAVQPGDPTQLMLYARARLRLGKLRDPAVDICLRNYPLAAHMAMCERISRVHAALRIDAGSGRLTVQDLGATNGTVLNGQRIDAGQLWELLPVQDHLLEFAGVVTLRLRALPRRDSASAAAGQPFGIEAAHALDAVVLTRPFNRPELAYAMVLRRLTIGGPGTDLALPQADGQGSCEVGLLGGRWRWRPGHGDRAWEPLQPDALLDCGGVRLRVRPGSHARC